MLKGNIRTRDLSATSLGKRGSFDVEWIKKLKVFGL